MNKIFLYIVVAISGAVVLAIEILGTRILGPFYGVSIFLWSALISVTLAALSTGYMLGGRMADRHPVHSRLFMLLLIAGLWIIAIPWIKHPFLSLTEPLGLRIAVLTAACILFFPPLTLLGMISPYAIKLKTQDLNEVGRTSGSLYAISTIASVISALLIGFILIPNIGVTFLTVLVGLMLLIVAVIGFILNKKVAASISTTTLVVVAIIFTGWKIPAEKADPENGLLAIEQSPYGEIKILNKEYERYLLIDGGIHSMVDTTTWNSYAHYNAVMELPKYFFIQPGKMLLLGVGAGSLIKQYKEDRWQVDAVDIDPVVIRMAYQYFGLTKSDGDVFEMDARRYLITTETKYDVVLIDVYGSSSIPFHLITEEAFVLIEKHLAKDGIVAVNVESIGWDDKIIGTISKTLKQKFANILALPMEEPPNQFGNIVILAANRELRPWHEPESNADFNPDWRYGPGYQKLHAWDNRYVPEMDHSEILTDDLNPIDIYSERINLASRKSLHEYFKQAGINPKAN